MKRVLALCLLFAGAAACGGDFQEDLSLVKRLRILSIAAEPPGLAPGNSTTLSALVVDPKGAGRPITYTWAVCLAAVVTPGDLPLSEAACANPAARIVIGTGATPTWAVPANTLSGLDLAQQQAGIDVPLVLEVRAGGDRHDAVKRVHIAEALAFDRNPTVTALRVNGSDPGSGAATVTWSSTVNLSATVTDPDAGNFATIEFFATTGSMDFNQTSSDGIVPWKLSGTQPADAWVYAVTRDGSGGNAWAARRVAF